MALYLPNDFTNIIGYFKLKASLGNLTRGTVQYKDSGFAAQKGVEGAKLNQTKPNHSNRIPVTKGKNITETPFKWLLPSLLF